MERPSKKFAIIIDGSLTAGVSINTAAHLSAQLGSMIPELGGSPVMDASGVSHTGLPIYPNAILQATAEEICQVISKARQAARGDGIIILDYPEQGHTTMTDEAYRQEMALVHEASLKYLGLLLYGERTEVNCLTRGLKLWQASQL